MMLLSISAFYFVNKNDPALTFSLLLVDKNDATVTFNLLLSQ